MNYWIISDTHFLHKNIIKYCNRNINFNKEIIRNWNNQVKKDDIVFHLGDITAGLSRIKDGYNKLKKIMNLLNGNIILIKGNHDYFSDFQYKNELNIKAVTDYHIYNKDYFFCHYPLIQDKYFTEVQKELLEIFKKSGCKYIIHGHSHLQKFGGNRINVSVDLIGMKPIKISKLLDYK